MSFVKEINPFLKADVIDSYRCAWSELLSVSLLLIHLIANIVSAFKNKQGF